MFEKCQTQYRKPKEKFDKTVTYAVIHSIADTAKKNNQSLSWRSN